VAIQPMEILKRGALYLLFVLLILFVGDWIVFEVRLARGGGIRSVPVEQFLKTPLKGDKAEYDFVGTAPESCSITMSPQYANSQWNPPCWWLNKHRVQWQ